MKNKFWCVLKVFLNKAFSDIFEPFIKLGIKGVLEIIGISLVISILFVLLFIVIAYFYSIIVKIFAFLLAIFVTIVIIWLTYCLIRDMIKNFMEKWQKSKEECWDILGDITDVKGENND